MLRGGGESIPLLSNQATVEYGGIEPKVHAGVGRSRIPIKASTGAVLGAGSTQQRIFATQLGSAAGDPDNPVGDWFYKQFYGDPRVTSDLRNILKDLITSEDYIPAEQLKPASKEWNKQTRQQYPLHWKKFKQVRDRLRAQQEELTRRRSSHHRPENPEEHYRGGVVLPFSNNIGPGNSVQPARTAADSIAQGHDIHYQNAKKPSDVLSADREAIGQFIHQAVGDKNPISQLQGLVGAVGLGAKHLTESLTGKVLYGNVFTIF